MVGLRERAADVLFGNNAHPELAARLPANSGHRHFKRRKQLRKAAANGAESQHQHALASEKS